MPDRKLLVITLGLPCSLALLALLLVVPIRLSGVVTDTSRPDGLRSGFTLPLGQPTTHLGAASAADAFRKMKALSSENEEEEGSDALNEQRVAFLSPWSFRKFPDRQAIALRSILSFYPLRC